MSRLFYLFVCGTVGLCGCAGTGIGAPSLHVQAHGAEGVAERNSVAFRPVGSEIWQPLGQGGAKGDWRAGGRDGGDWKGRRGGRGGHGGGDWRGRGGGRGGHGWEGGYGWDDGYGWDGGWGYPVFVPWGFGVPYVWPNLINAPLIDPLFYGGLGLGAAYGALGLGAGYPGLGWPYAAPLATGAVL